MGKTSFILSLRKISWTQQALNKLGTYAAQNLIHIGEERKKKKRDKIHSSPQTRRGFSLQRFSRNSQMLHGITWESHIPLSRTSAPEYGTCWWKMIYAQKYSISLTRLSRHAGLFDDFFWFSTHTPNLLEIWQTVWSPILGSSRTYWRLRKASFLLLRKPVTIYRLMWSACRQVGGGNCGLGPWNVKWERRCSEDSVIFVSCNTTGYVV
jgi:hypothetical protein